MSCCHTDFALTADSDKAFTVGMPTFTFGAGCLAEAGAHAQELGLKRVALFTDRNAGELRAPGDGAGLAVAPRRSTWRSTTR